MPKSRKRLPAETEHVPAQYTVEGLIDGFGSFAVGVTNARRRKRRFAKAVVIWLLFSPLVLGIVVMAVSELQK